MPEGPFSRRAAGQNPIALELTRLAETQKGPQVLGRSPRASVLDVPGGAPGQQQTPDSSFQSLLGRLALHERGQRGGVFSQVSDEELGQAVLGAQNQLARAVRSGTAVVDPSGNVETVQGDPNVLSGALDTIGEWQKRQGMDDAEVMSGGSPEEQAYLKQKAEPVFDRILEQMQPTGK